MVAFWEFDLRGFPHFACGNLLINGIGILFDWQAVDRGQSYPHRGKTLAKLGSVGDPHISHYFTAIFHMFKCVEML